MRINDPRTFGGKHLTTIEDVKLLLQGVSASVGEHGYAFLDASGKVDTSLIPPLAISQTYTIVDDGTSSKLDLIKNAITEAGVERGDIVIITAKAEGTVERANEVCGTVIFTKDVADKSTIAASDFAAIYVPGGSVTSVNGVAPVNGEVTLNLTNLGLSENNVTAIKKLTEVDGSVAYDSKALATKESVDTLAGRVTTVEGTVTELSGKVDTNTGNITTLSGKVDKNIADIATLSGTKYIKYVDNFDTDPADPVEGTIYVSSEGQTKAYVNGEFIAISVEVSDDILSGDDNNVATVGAVKTYVSGQIDTVNGTISGFNTELKGLITAEEGRATAAESALGTRIDELSGKVADSSALDALSGQVQTIESNVTTLSGSVDTLSSTFDEHIATATPVIETAIKLTKITQAWSSTDKTGDTYTKTISGHVIQVCDSEGWVIPGVKFDGTNSIITVKMDPPSGSIDGESWDYYVATLANA